MASLTLVDNVQHTPTRSTTKWAVGGGVLVLVLALWSTLTGTAHMNLWEVITGQADFDQLQILFVSRIPRTLAIILSGSSMAVAGLVMQMLVQNRYVEPSTTGVTESAGVGILLITVFVPEAPLVLKMAFAIVFALFGTLLLIFLVRSIRHRDIIIVPLLGIVLSGIIGAAALFLAWEFTLQGTLEAWRIGDFSGVLRGRYELLWVVAIAAVLAYLYADMFTVAGLGENVSRSLGLDHRRITMIGLVIVAIVAGVTTVVSGMLPFLGLVVPNVVSLLVGDYMRRSLPLVAFGGAAFVLASDIIGRSIIPPAEIPVGVVMGVIGAGIFLVFLLRTMKR